MSLENNVETYKESKIDQLSDVINNAGGSIRKEDLLTMTLNDFFNKLPQNGIEINFGYSTFLLYSIQRL